METSKTPKSLLPFILLLLALSFAIVTEKAAAESYLPPTLSVKSLGPNPATPGQLVNLNFTASDPNGGITATWVDWGDGSTPDLIYNMTSGSMCQHLTNPSIDQCSIPPGSLLTFAQPDLSKIVPTCAGGNYTCTSPPNGTIIAFRPPTPFSNDPLFIIVHRVVAEKGTGLDSVFYTRGDANFGSCFCPSSNDPWDSYGGLQASQVIGIYKSTVVPPGGPTVRYYTHSYAPLNDSTPLTYVIRITASGTYGQSSSVIAETVETLRSSSLATILGMPPILYGLAGLVASLIVIIVVISLRAKKNQSPSMSNTQEAPR